MKNILILLFLLPIIGLCQGSGSTTPNLKQVANAGNISSKVIKYRNIRSGFTDSCLVDKKYVDSVASKTYEESGNFKLYANGVDTFEVLIRYDKAGNPIDTNFSFFDGACNFKNIPIPTLHKPKIVFISCFETGTTTKTCQGIDDGDFKQVQFLNTTLRTDYTESIFTQGPTGYAGFISSIQPNSFTYLFGASNTCSTSLVCYWHAITQ